MSIAPTKALDALAQVVRLLDEEQLGAVVRWLRETLTPEQFAALWRAMYPLLQGHIPAPTVAPEPGEAPLAPAAQPVQPHPAGPEPGEEPREPAQMAPGGATGGAEAFGVWSGKILLWQENRGAHDYGIRNVVHFVRPEQATARSEWDVAIWHPWYEDEHGIIRDANQAFPWRDAGTGGRLGYLQANIRLALQRGFRWWGVDWEGGLLMPDGLDVLAAAAAYARQQGLRVAHTPSTGWMHQAGSYRRSPAQMDTWATRHCDGLLWWHPSSTLEAYQDATHRLRQAGFRGPVGGLAYAGKGVPDAEDRRIVAGMRGIFNPGNSVAAGLVQYARGLQA